MDRCSPCPGCEGGEFGGEAVDEGGLAVAIVYEAVKIAVVALVEAKRDVDVERGHWGVIVPRGRAGAERCGRGNRGPLPDLRERGILGHAAAAETAACGKDTPRWKSLLLQYRRMVGSARFI